MNTVDLTIEDPNIFAAKMIDYIKPRIRYNMEHNSTGFAKEKEFEFQIPKMYENTKPVRR